MTTEAPSDSTDADLQRVLAALEDDDCRRILRALDRPRTANEIMDACDLSQTTTYRKLDRLSETPLVDEQLEIRDDGHHTQRYERAVEGVFVGLDEDDLFDLQLVEQREPEALDEALARLWTRIGEEL